MHKAYECPTRLRDNPIKPRICAFRTSKWTRYIMLTSIAHNFLFIVGIVQCTLCLIGFFIPEAWSEYTLQMWQSAYVRWGTHSAYTCTSIFSWLGAPEADYPLFLYSLSVLLGVHTLSMLLAGPERSRLYMQWLAQRSFWGIRLGLGAGFILGCFLSYNTF